MYDLKSVRILIVDDEYEIRESLSDFFTLKGFTNVQTATNGREALEVISKAEKKFDIILSDVVMPEMNGFQFVDEICHHISRDSLVFMMTGTHLDDVKARYFSGQIQGFLKKPFDIKFLFQIVIDTLFMLRQ